MLRQERVDEFWRGYYEEIEGWDEVIENLKRRETQGTDSDPRGSVLPRDID